MRVMSILRNTLGRSLQFMHSRRRDALWRAVEGLVLGGRLWLTGLGRDLPGKRTPRDNDACCPFLPSGVSSQPAAMTPNSVRMSCETRSTRFMKFWRETPLRNRNRDRDREAGENEGILQSRSRGAALRSKYAI